MGGKSANPFSLRLPFYGLVYGLVGAAGVVLPTMIFGNGIETILGTAVIGATIGAIISVVFFRTIRLQSWAALSMVAVFSVGVWLLFNVSDDVRTAGRWLLQSRKYKAQILDQPNALHGERKHAQWDGWGFAGAGETVVYLVFDPNDSLRAAADSQAPGKYIGIPCEVPSVRRLENHWYTVRFYTDTLWDHCS